MVRAILDKRGDGGTANLLAYVILTEPKYGGIREMSDAIYSCLYLEN